MKAWIIAATLIVNGCVSYPRPYPWNFPDEQEWNAPLETSWVNAVDTYRKLTSPPGKIYDPIMRSYQPNLAEGGEDTWPRRKKAAAKSAKMPINEPVAGLTPVTGFTFSSNDPGTPHAFPQ